MASSTGGTGHAEPARDLALIRRAASQRDAQAPFNLSCIYKTGEGVSADLVEAERLYVFAAALGAA